MAEAVFRAEVVKHVRSLKILVADIEVSSKVNWSIIMDIGKLINTLRQLGKFFKEVAFFS